MGDFVMPYNGQAPCPGCTTATFTRLKETEVYKLLLCGLLICKRLLIEQIKANTAL